MAKRSKAPHRTILPGIDGRPMFAHKRMAAKDTLTEDTGRKLMTNIQREIANQEAENWLKAQFWKWFPSALLLVFAVIAIFMLR